MSGSSDWELLRRASSDGEAFEELVRRHYRGAVAFAAQVLGDGFQAEDVVQRGLVKVYGKRHTLEDRSPFRSLLFRVVLNESLKEVRRRSSTRALSSLSEESAVHRGGWIVDGKGRDPLGDLEACETRSVVDGALSRLRPEHRAALYLREQERLSYQEVADTLGASLGEVKVWIHRGRRRLMDLLRPYLEHAGSFRRETGSGSGPPAARGVPGW